MRKRCENKFVRPLTAAVDDHSKLSREYAKTFHPWLYVEHSGEREREREDVNKNIQSKRERRKRWRGRRRS